MKLHKLVILLHLMALTASMYGQKFKEDKKGIDLSEFMIRIAEIEIRPEYLDEYVNILMEESEASVRLEPGVICIYPMFQKQNPTEIRLLEIYANKEAYESHLQTAHFKHYKETTLKMVKALKLIDMEAIDLESMPMIFKKIK